MFNPKWINKVSNNLNHPYLSTFSYGVFPSFICSTQSAFPIYNNPTSPLNMKIKRNNFINKNIKSSNYRIACLSNISKRNNSKDINNEFPDLNIYLFALYEGKLIHV